MVWEEVARRLPYPTLLRISSRNVVLRPVSGPMPPSIFGSFFSFREFGGFFPAFLKRILCCTIPGLEVGSENIADCAYTSSAHQRCADDK